MSETDEITLRKGLKEQLNAVIENEGIENNKISVTRAVSKGENYVGTIYRAKISGNNSAGNEKTLNLIIKCAPENEQLRQRVNPTAAYEREAFCYTILFPELLKFQQEKMVSKPFNSFAKCYRTCLEENLETIILEDMRPHGYVMLNRMQPLNLDHCLLVMREYAKLHALCFAIKDQRPEVYQKLLQGTKEIFFSSRISNSIERGFGRRIDEIIKTFDSKKDSDLITKLGDFKEIPDRGLAYLLSAETAGDYVVINHGDGWINNILFRYKDSDNTNSPEELCLLDWQLARCASPALDLSYFIFLCTDKKLRDEHYDELLKTYHETLSSFLKELGSDSTIFPYDALLDHMRKFSKYALMMGMFVIHVMLLESDEAVDLTVFKSEQDRASYLENTKNIHNSNSRIREVIQDFYRLGYLQ